MKEVDRAQERFRNNKCFKKTCGCNNLAIAIRDVNHNRKLFCEIIEFLRPELMFNELVKSYLFMKRSSTSRRELFFFVVYFLDITKIYDFLALSPWVCPRAMDYNEEIGSIQLREHYFYSVLFRIKIFFLFKFFCSIHSSFGNTTLSLTWRHSLVKNKVVNQLVNDNWLVLRGNLTCARLHYETENDTFKK